MVIRLYLLFPLIVYSVPIEPIFLFELERPDSSSASLPGFDFQWRVGERVLPSLLSPSDELKERFFKKAFLRDTESLIYKG